MSLVKSFNIISIILIVSSVLILITDKSSENYLVFYAIFLSSLYPFVKAHKEQINVRGKVNILGMLAIFSMMGATISFFVRMFPLAI